MFQLVGAAFSPKANLEFIFKVDSDSLGKTTTLSAVHSSLYNLEGSFFFCVDNSCHYGRVYTVFHWQLGSPVRYSKIKIR